MVLLINNGRGSLDFARRLVTRGNSDEEPQTDPTNNALPGWFICKNCTRMPTPEENKCCRRRECITSYELFQNLCLDRHVLELKELMSRTIAVHVRYNSLYISLSCSAKQRREMTKSCVVWRTWTTTANFLFFIFKLIAVFRI